MRLLFALIGLLGFSISATAANEWLYYKHYPWVYDNVSKDWLYLRGAAGGEIYAYRSSTKEWEVFEVQELQKTWDEQYAEWIKDPEPYGGLAVLQQIKDAKESGATVLELWANNISEIFPLEGLTNLTELSLSHNNISDLSPLAGLTNLTRIELNDNKISDLSPLAGLTNLTRLILVDNPITASQKAMLETALPSTTIYWPDVIIDDSQETEKTWDEQYEEWVQNPEPYGGLSVLQQIKQAKDNGATYLYLDQNNITDLTPLAGLTNLEELRLNGNNISDLTPLAGLTNLGWLDLRDNNISDPTPLIPLTGSSKLDWLHLQDNPINLSKKAILEYAPLPNTTINWPDVIIDDSQENPTWDKKYEEWIQNPEPYGGINVLEEIKFVRYRKANITELVLENKKISDFTPLAGLSYLTSLNLSKNNISDITPLVGLTNLEELRLDGNNISDLTPLEGMKNLWLLGLVDNNISDLTPLAGLKNLQYLDLKENNISASQKSMLEKALYNTNFRWY